MPLLALALLLTAAPAPSTVRVKLALPEVTAVNLDPKVANFLAEHLGRQMKDSGVDVVTHREISTLLGLERQKELLGCSEGTTCMVELASALGADGVVLADFARLNDVIRLSVKIISATDARTLATFSAQAKNENEAADALSIGARELATQVRAALGREPLEVLAPVVLTASPARPSSARRFFWVPVAGGAVVAAGGVYLFLQGANGYQQLISPHAPPLSSAVARAYRNSGPLNEGLGVGLIAAGAVAAGVGAAMLIFAGSSSNAVALAPTPDGAAVVFSGRLP